MRPEPEYRFYIVSVNNKDETEIKGPFASAEIAAFRIYENPSMIDEIFEKCAEPYGFVKIKKKEKKDE